MPQLRRNLLCKVAALHENYFRLAKNHFKLNNAQTESSDKLIIGP
jgi:hypothetical protein